MSSFFGNFNLFKGADKNPVQQHVDIPVLITGESFTGNGVTTVFTTAYAVTHNSSSLFYDGVRQLRGTDYTESSTGFTTNFTPTNGSILIFDYLKA